MSGTTEHLRLVAARLYGHRLLFTPAWAAPQPQAAPRLYLGLYLGPKSLYLGLVLPCCRCLGLGCCCLGMGAAALGWVLGRCMGAASSRPPYVLVRGLWGFSEIARRGVCCRGCELGSLLRWPCGRLVQGQGLPARRSRPPALKLYFVIKNAR